MKRFSGTFVPLVATACFISTRSFWDFASALDDVADARVFGGIHYRSACRDGRSTGVQVAEYVLEHALRPLHGEHEAEER